MINKLLKKSSGFTLVETLVSVAILSLSILGAFTAVQGGLQASIVAKDQVTAFYLAQEAMEYIKNIRDNNALSSLNGTAVSWLNGLSEFNDASNPCYFGKTCRIDSYNKTVTDCSGDGASCSNLKQDPTTGLFGYTPAWTSTNFRRSIQFTSTATDEVIVTVTINWTTRGIAQSFAVKEVFFNRE